MESAPIARSSLTWATEKRGEIMNVKIRWAIVCVILSLSSARGQKVETQYDHKLDFSRYKTYAWGERKLLTQQGPENQKVIEDSLVQAVDTQLRAKGFTEDKNAPDFTVNLYGGSRIADAKVGAGYVPWDLMGWGVVNSWATYTVPGSIPNVWVAMEGLALFQIVDAKTQAVAWATLLKKRLKNPGKMPKDIDKAATQLAAKGLKSFPPSGGS